MEISSAGRLQRPLQSKLIKTFALRNFVRNICQAAILELTPRPLQNTRPVPRCPLYLAAVTS